MSETLRQLRQELAENPYVTFDSDGKGKSRVFDVEWDFRALKQNTKILCFGHIDVKYPRYSVLPLCADAMAKEEFEL